MKKDKGKEIRDNLFKTIKNSAKTARVSPYLKKRVDIRCKCRRQKSNDKNRIKFGTCRCDSYSLHYTLGNVMANYLYQYLADCKHFIIREDWDIIEKHAEAIREYTEADSWDSLSKEKGVKSAYLKKEKAWREAMKWLTKEWNSLWW